MGSPRDNDTAGSFEFLDHAADVGIRLQAPTLTGLFTTAAAALMTWIGPAPEKGELQQTEVVLAAEGLDELLVKWLQELLYLFYQGQVYTMKVPRMEIEEHSLRAALFGTVWDESCCGDYQEVKAVTYHKLRVSRDESGWSANIILDI
jgi:SHS2 domain-containing protein